LNLNRYVRDVVLLKSLSRELEGTKAETFKGFCVKNVVASLLRRNRVFIR